MFLNLLYLFILISYTTLLPIDKPHAVAVDIGIAIKQIPVSFKVKEPDVVAIRINVSNDFNFVVSVLYFLYLFFDFLFLSLKYVIISLMLLIWLLKLLSSFNFFLFFVQDQYFYFQMVLRDIIYLFSGPFIYHNRNKLT